MAWMAVNASGGAARNVQWMELAAPPWFKGKNVLGRGVHALVEFVVMEVMLWRLPIQGSSSGRVPEPELPCLALVGLQPLVSRSKAFLCFSVHARGMSRLC